MVAAAMANKKIELVHSPPAVRGFESILYSVKRLGVVYIILVRASPVRNVVSTACIWLTGPFKRLYFVTMNAQSGTTVKQ
jgi:hypothetical protein